MLASLRFKKKNTGGYTLFEIVIYVGILMVVFLTVFGLMSSIMRSFIIAKIYNDVRISGGTAMDRIMRESRAAYAVDSANSIFDTHPGQLQLFTTDDLGNPKTIRFSFDVDNNAITLLDDGVDKGVITGSGVLVTNFVVRKSDNAKSTLVKIDIGLQSVKKNDISGGFSSSAVLRGAYSN